MEMIDEILPFLHEQEDEATKDGHDCVSGFLHLAHKVVQNSTVGICVALVPLELLEEEKGEHSLSCAESTRDPE